MVIGEVNNGSAVAVHAHSLVPHTGSFAQHTALGEYIEGVELPLAVALKGCFPSPLCVALHLEGFDGLAIVASVVDVEPNAICGGEFYR